MLHPLEITFIFAVMEYAMTFFSLPLSSPHSSKQAVFPSLVWSGGSGGYSSDNPHHYSLCHLGRAWGGGQWNRQHHHLV